MNNSTYLNYLVDRLVSLDIDSDMFSAQILKCIKSGGHIWIIGNGGSASTAEHFETDLAFVKADSISQQIKTCALTSNSALITAIANDIGFQYIFSHQLLRKASSGDLCIMISASGNSSNLIEAVRICKQLKITTLALLGFDGGELVKFVDYPILVRTELGRYGPVEDIHLALCHLVSEKVLRELSSKNGN